MFLYSVACYAYVRSQELSPLNVRERDWMIVDVNIQSDYKWVHGSAELLSAHREDGLAHHKGNIYKAVRRHRSLKALPEGQSYYSLRNGIPMPVVGLGTGGLAPDQTPQILKSAFEEGYRLLDLAREYGNEWIVPRVLRELQVVGAGPDGEPIAAVGAVNQSDVFVITKVWPTQVQPPSFSSLAH